MRIPLKYNLRSLWVRRTGTLMTAAGIALTVAIVVVIAAMVNGLDATFENTGDEAQLIVIRKGSQNETNSYFNRDLFETVRFLPGVARDGEEPLAAGELLVVINCAKLDGDTSNVSMRGTSDMSFRLREGLQVTAGRIFQKGLREVIVSESLANRFQDMQLGDELVVNENAWKVVGIYEATGTAYDSEVWADYEQIAQVWRRPIYTSILLRANSVGEARQLAERISDDQRIQLDALNQKEYFEAQTIASAGLKALGLFIAFIVGIGSCFAIMNMMYGAVMAREQEVATLRALGFKRRSILSSFLLEAAALALLGGALGCSLAFLFNGYSAGTLNFAAFSEVVFNFRITGGIVLLGMAFALFTGLLGGFLPARRAASVRLIDVLRK